jgi:hypothetical protein
VKLPEHLLRELKQNVHCTSDDADYVVTAMECGGKAVAQFVHETSSMEEKQDVFGKLTLSVKSASFNLDTSAEFKMTESEKELSENVRFQETSDIMLKGPSAAPATNFVEAINRIKLMAEAITEPQDGTDCPYGVPIKATLEPVSTNRFFYLP